MASNRGLGRSSLRVRGIVRVLAPLILTTVFAVACNIGTEEMARDVDVVVTRRVDGSPAAGAMITPVLASNDCEHVAIDDHFVEADVEGGASFTLRWGVGCSGFSPDAFECAATLHDRLEAEIAADAGNAPHSAGEGCIRVDRDGRMESLPLTFRDGFEVDGTEFRVVVTQVGSLRRP